MELPEKLASLGEFIWLALCIACAIICYSFYSGVFGFSSPLVLFLAYFIYYQPLSIKAYGLILLGYPIAVFCLTILPLGRRLLFGFESLDAGHPEGLVQLFPLKGGGSERDEDSEKPFYAEFITPSPPFRSLLVYLVLIHALPANSIVAVHGLGSNPHTTWLPRKSSRSEDGSSQIDPTAKPMWLRDILPQDLQGHGFRVRVLAFNHNTRWKVNAPSKSLQDYAEDLLRKLDYKRQLEEVSNHLSLDLY